MMPEGITGHMLQVGSMKPHVTHRQHVAACCMGNIERLQQHAQRAVRIGFVLLERLQQRCSESSAHRLSTTEIVGVLVALYPDAY